MYGPILKGLALGAIPLAGIGAYGGYRYYNTADRRNRLYSDAMDTAKRALPMVLGAGLAAGAGGFAAGRYKHGLASRIQGGLSDRVRGFAAPHMFPALESETGRLKSDFNEKTRLFRNTGISDLPIRVSPFEAPDLTGASFPAHYLKGGPVKQSAFQDGIKNIIAGALIKEITDKRAALSPGLIKGLAGGLGLSALGLGGYHAFIKPKLDAGERKMDTYDKVIRFAGNALPVLLGAGAGFGGGYLAGRNSGRGQLDRSVDVMRSYNNFSQMNEGLDANIRRAVSSAGYNGGVR